MRASHRILPGFLLSFVVPHLFFTSFNTDLIFPIKLFYYKKFQITEKYNINHSTHHPDLTNVNTFPY